MQACTWRAISSMVANQTPPELQSRRPRLRPDLAGQAQDDRTLASLLAHCESNIAWFIYSITLFPNISRGGIKVNKLCVKNIFYKEFTSIAFNFKIFFSCFRLHSSNSYAAVRGCSI